MLDCHFPGNAVSRGPVQVALRQHVLANDPPKIQDATKTARMLLKPISTKYFRPSRIDHLKRLAKIEKSLNKI
jgi:hypothetical protein